MRTPHRAHHSKLEHAFVGVLTLVVACGRTTLPRPPRAQVRVEDYVAVPFPPRPPPVEIVPAPPRPGAVWVDGTWTWEGDRYAWQPGYWSLPPEGAAHTRWVIVRRSEDGQLFFAPSSWQGPDGEPLPEPEALVRARSRATDVE
jgi:hypothetical protein